MRVRLKTKSIFLICIAITCAFMFLSSTQLVYASSYGSWTEGTGDSSSVYGITGSVNDKSSSGIPEDEIEEHETKKAGWASRTFTKVMIAPFYSLAEFMDGVGLSIDDVVLGRLAAGNTTAPFQFDLADGNIYGTIGAIVYSILRNFMFGILGIYFVYLLTSYLITGTGKGKADLKGAVYNFIFVFALLFAVPIAVDYMLLFRDALMTVIISFTSSLSGAATFKGINLAFMFYAKIDETKDFGFLMLGYLCLFGMLWLSWNYIKIAIQQAYLFGIFPLVAFKSFQDKGILGKWFNQFFANMIVPMLDLVGFSILAWIVDGTIDTDKPGYYLFILLVFFCIIPSRNYILQLFGAPIPGKGFNMLPLLLMAGRLFGSGGGGSSSGEAPAPNKMPSSSGSPNAASAASANGNDTIKDIGNGASAKAEANANAAGGITNSETNANGDGTSSSTGEMPVGESGTQVEAIGGELGESAPSGIEESESSYEIDKNITDEGTVPINTMDSSDGVIQTEAPVVETVNEATDSGGDTDVIPGEIKEISNQGDAIPDENQAPTTPEPSNVELADQQKGQGQVNSDVQTSPETITPENTPDLASLPGSKASVDEVDVGGAKTTSTSSTAIGNETKAGSSGGGNADVGTTHTSSTNNITNNDTYINTHKDSGVSKISSSVNTTGGTKDETVRFTPDGSNNSVRIRPEQAQQARMLLNDMSARYDSLNKVSKSINSALSDTLRNDYDFGTPAGKSISEAYKYRDKMNNLKDASTKVSADAGKSMTDYKNNPWKGVSSTAETARDTISGLSTAAGVVVGTLGVASTAISGDASTIAGAAGIGVVTSKIGDGAAGFTSDVINGVSDKHKHIVNEDFIKANKLLNKASGKMINSGISSQKAVDMYNKGLKEALNTNDTSLIKISSSDSRPTSPEVAADINKKAFESILSGKPVELPTEKVKVSILGRTQEFDTKGLTKEKIYDSFKLDGTVSSATNPNKKGDK